MATTFNTRITNKIDTLENWNLVKDSFIPLKGEICIATVSTQGEGVQSPPQTLMKIGDGASKFGELKWLAAPAADIIDSLKGNNPTLPATSITGLDDYIDGQIQDTNTLYRIIASGDMGIQLQSKEKGEGDESFKNVGDPIVLTAPTYNLIPGEANGTIKFGITGEEAEVAVTGLKSGAYTDMASLALAEVTCGEMEIIGSIKQENGIVTATKKTLVEADIPEISISKVTNLSATLDKKQPVGDYATKAEAQSYADAKVGSIGAIDASVTIGGTATAPIVGVKVSPDVGNALSLAENGLKVTIPTAVEYSVTKDDNAGEFAAVYHLTKNGENVGAAINIPKDMVVKSGSVVENPADQPPGTYIELVLQNVEDPIYINVGDLIEYVTGGTATDGMITVSVSDSHVATATINDGTITLAKLASAVQTEINKAHEHDNKNVLDGIDAIKVAAWDSAEANAKSYTDTEISSAKTDLIGSDVGVTATTIKGAVTEAKSYADGLNSAMDARVDALETDSHTHDNKALLDTYTQTEANLADAVAKKHEHSNKTVLDGITDKKVSAWDGKVDFDDLATVATSGKIDDLTQTATIILNCGTSNTVIN